MTASSDETLKISGQDPDQFFYLCLSCCSGMLKGSTIKADITPKDSSQRSLMFCLFPLAAISATRLRIGEPTQYVREVFGLQSDGRGRLWYRIPAGYCRSSWRKVLTS